MKKITILSGKGGVGKVVLRHLLLFHFQKKIKLFVQIVMLTHQIFLYYLHYLKINMKLGKNYLLIRLLLLIIKNVLIVINV